MEFDGCPCSGKTLARLVQPAVMAVLADEPLHGYRIVQRLMELAMFKCQPPDATGVYRLLKSMEAEGRVISTWDLAESGPAKRRFALTGEGRACLRRWTGTLEVYQAAIGDLMDMMKQKKRRGRPVSR